MCEICNRNMGETVIDFNGCARKCTSPFYCLTPKPQLEICTLCATTSTPVIPRHAIKQDRRGSESTNISSSSNEF